MAYGMTKKPPMRSSKPIKASSQPLTSKEQQGRTGTSEASAYAQPNFGKLPSSGNFEKNAGSREASTGGPTKGAGASMKPNMGTAPSWDGPNVTHAQQKKPLKPGSHGGPNTGSVDTLTKLFFHPKGGLGNKAPASRKSPPSAPGYKDSGARGGAQKTGVSS
jgi:hypothetical protein